MAVKKVGEKYVAFMSIYSSQTQLLSFRRRRSEASALAASDGEDEPEEEDKDDEEYEDVKPAYVHVLSCIYYSVSPFTLHSQEEGR